MMNDPEIEELIELARQAPAPPGQHLSGASEAEISDLETQIGRTLSPGFRRWLKAVNGAMLGPGGMFGVRGTRDFLSIRKYLAIYPEWQSLGWVPVASDGLGNYWVAVPQGPDGSPDWVAFIDTHEDPASVDRYVASSVLRFIWFLLKSELGETRWPGDRSYDLEHDPALLMVPEDKAAWSSRLLSASGMPTPGRAGQAGCGEGIVRMSPPHLRYESHVFVEPTALKDILQHLPSVRRALFIDGVPKKFIAHRYRADSDVTLLRRQGDDTVLRFGSSGLSDAVGIHLATGNVVEEINARGSPLYFVNTSIEKFVLTMQAVIDRFPYYDQDATDGEIEAAAADLRDIIRSIDSPAMVPDRYWSTFADDVENGDMSTEEVLAIDDES